jgi:hypothetical protein
MISVMPKWSPLYSRHNPFGAELCEDKASATLKEYEEVEKVRHIIYLMPPTWHMQKQAKKAYVQSSWRHVYAGPAPRQ